MGRIVSPNVRAALAGLSLLAAVVGAVLLLSGLFGSVGRPDGNDPPVGSLTLPEPPALRSLPLPRHRPAAPHRVRRRTVRRVQRSTRADATRPARNVTLPPVVAGNPPPPVVPPLPVAGAGVTTAHKVTGLVRDLGNVVPPLEPVTRTVADTVDGLLPTP